jgi:hypothetical protein
MVDVDRECRRMAELEARVSPPRRRGASYAADIAKAGRAFMRALDARNTRRDREMAEAVGRYLQDVRAPKRGAPKRDDRFADFLDHLLTVTCGFGGSITFNRKTGKGNVVDLIHELRPLMPEGVIPNALPMSTIERLAAKARGSMSGPGMVDNVPRILAALREIISKHEKEDEEERVETALIHEQILAEELGHVCPECGEPRLEAAALAPLSQVSKIPVDRLLSRDISQDEPAEPTPDRDVAPAILKVITGGLSSS